MELAVFHPTWLRMLQLAGGVLPGSIAAQRSAQALYLAIKLCRAVG